MFQHVAFLGWMASVCHKNFQGVYLYILLLLLLLLFHMKRSIANPESHTEETPGRLFPCFFWGKTYPNEHQ